MKKGIAPSASLLVKHQDYLEGIDRFGRFRSHKLWAIIMAPTHTTHGQLLDAYTQGCEDIVAGVFDGYEVNNTFT
jgi:hypothetical protein